MVWGRHYTCGALMGTHCAHAPFYLNEDDRHSGNAHAQLMALKGFVATPQKVPMPLILTDVHSLRNYPPQRPTQLLWVHPPASVYPERSSQPRSEFIGRMSVLFEALDCKGSKCLPSASPPESISDFPPASLLSKEEDGTSF